MVRSTSSSKRYQMGAGEIHPINFNRYLFASVLKGNVLFTKQSKERPEGRERGISLRGII